MKAKFLVITSAVLLCACAESPEDRAQRECVAALDQIEINEVRLGPLTIECMKRVYAAEHDARDEVVQQYRNMPRKKEVPNENSNDSSDGTDNANQQ